MYQRKLVVIVGTRDCAERINKMFYLLQRIIEKFTRTQCTKCLWYNGRICTIDQVKYEKCVNSIYPRYFKRRRNAKKALKDGV